MADELAGKLASPRRSAAKPALKLVRKLQLSGFRRTRLKDQGTK
jgi:hypothetical protein